MVEGAREHNLRGIDVTFPSSSQYTQILLSRNLRFTFNERDFAERCEQAGIKLGFIDGRLGEDEPLWVPEERGCEPEPLAHAEPVEQAIPARSRAMTNAWRSRPTNTPPLTTARSPITSAAACPAAANTSRARSTCN